MKKNIIFLFIVICNIYVYGQDEIINLDYLNSPQYKVERGVKYLQNGKYDEAFTDFATAHNAGNLDATYLVGDCYFSGIGVEKDEKKAFELYNYAATNGHIDACFVVGAIYYNGINQGNLNLESDPARGKEWLKTAADKGHSDAQWLLGDCYYLDENYEAAYDRYLQSAKQNNPKGLKRVAVRLMDGVGVEKNLSLALEYLSKAEEFGKQDPDIKETDLMFIRGKIYYHQKNYDKAIEIFKSIYQTDAEACRWLGSCYVGKCEDYTTAIKYWELSAEKGEFKGMLYTALCYYDGLGCEKDYGKAVDLFFKILPSGGKITSKDEKFYDYAIVAKFLSNCYRYGRGVPANAETAAELLKFAAAAGFENITIKEVLTRKK